MAVSALPNAMKGVLAGSYPIAEELHATELSLPISAGHTARAVGRVAALVEEFVGKAVAK